MVRPGVADEAPVAADSPRRGRLTVVGRRPSGQAPVAPAAPADGAVVAPLDAAPPRGVGASLPFGGAQAMVVSAPAVRSALAAWAAAEPRDDGDAVAWPQALLVAMAIVEAGRATLGAAAEAAPWELDVTIAPAPRDLLRRTALPPRVVRRAIDALVSAEILDSVRRVGDLQVVRFRPTAFEDAPIVGLVCWDGVRERLGVALSPAALLTVRELACRTTPADRAREQFVPATLRELEDATGYGKGALRSALTALAAAALVESRVRPRMDSWHRLLPGVFAALEAPPLRAEPPTPVRRDAARPAPVRVAGEPDGSRAAVRSAAPVPPVPLVEPGRVQGADRPSARPGVPEVRGGPERGEAPAEWAIVEINGVPFPVPPGVQPIPERDASGDWYLRVGPALRYGPLRFFA